MDTNGHESILVGRLFPDSCEFVSIRGLRCISDGTLDAI
jgi:hypothetical protein